MTSATKRARWCGGSASRSLTVKLRVASSSTVVHFRVMPRVSHTVDVSTEASLRQAASHGSSGIRLRRDSWMSVMDAEGLHAATSSVTLQRTDRQGILGQKPADFQRSL